MSDDKPEEKDIETERKQSPLDEYRYKVDTGAPSCAATTHTRFSTH